MRPFFLLTFLLIALPGFAQEDDDALLKKIEAERAGQAQVTNQINEVKEGVENKVIDVAEEVKRLGYQTVNFDSLFDKRVVDLLKQGIEQGKLWELSLKEKKALLLQNVKGRKIEKTFQKNPRFHAFCADFIYDREAMPALLGIFNRKKDLQTYAILALIIFILTMIARRSLTPKKKKGGTLKRVLIGISLSIFSMSLTAFIFYQIFRPELLPTVTVIQRHF